MSSVDRNLSIIVIAYNEEQGIERCLASLLAQQTTVDYEVIVVDDGSRDQTAKIVRGIGETDQRLRLINHETNLGRGAARRTGQDATNSPLVAFIDADIEVPPNWVDRCVQELKTCSAVSGLACPDGDCAVIWRIFKPGIRERRGPAAITGNNVMYRAEALSAEPFDVQSRLGEDFRQASRLAARGLVLRTVLELKVTHRESRTYLGALKWMWALGVDAATHPIELGTFRLPDFTWILWIGSTLMSVIAASVGVVPWWAVPACFGSTTLIVDLAYIYSRFQLWPKPIRWVGAASANVPLMATYLVGRTWGLMIFALPQRRLKLRL
jgi:glycosyltransferase involved in cell wall biosynthesis